MVGSWARGRVMASGIRANTAVANRAGLKYICFNEGFPESEMRKIDAFTESLKAEVSPYLENGKLSESASRGKRLFEGKANCASCHGGDLYGADVLVYENYVQSATETRGLLVPPLVEAWRTAPYLHDGSAATIMDVLTTRNVTGTHGNVSGLTEQELTDLCNYVLSLGTEFEDSLVVSCDVIWSAMTFKYEGGTWNPNSHLFEGGNWVHKVNGQTTEAMVQISNRGTVGVTASLTYASKEGYEDFNASLQVDGAAPPATLALASGEDLKYTVTLTGPAPANELNSVTVGRLTLSIAS